MDANAIQQFASDPAAFQDELTIPSAYGPRRFGDVMAQFQRDRFASLNPALLSLARGEKPAIPRHWWEATKGASKDSDLGVALLWLLIFSQRPLLVQVGAADQDQAGELLKAVRDVVSLNPWIVDLVKLTANKITATHNGATCEILAADVAGSHGARPDVLLINELSHIVKKEFAENLADNATKMPGGLAIIATNAGFVGTWQHEWRAQARTSTRWAFHQLAEPAPWIDPAELQEAAVRNSATRYRRLWWGVWAAGSGDALDENDIAAAITLPLPGSVTVTQPGWIYCAGLDLSTSRDFSALVVTARHVGHSEQVRIDPPIRSIPSALAAAIELGIADAPPDEPDSESRTVDATLRTRLVSVQVWKPPAGGKIDLDAIERATLETCQRLGVVRCAFDPWQAELLAQRLEREGVSMVPVPATPSNLTTMAGELLRLFADRQIDLYDDPQLLADLRAVALVERSYGARLVSQRSATGGHGDALSAFVLSLLTLRDFRAPLGPPRIEGELVCWPR